MQLAADGIGYTGRTTRACWGLLWLKRTLDPGDLVRCLVRILLLAWSQSLAIAAEHTSCAELQIQLGLAVAAVASLEAQLEEARQLVVTKELEVSQCESGKSATTARRGGELVGGVDHCLTFQRVSDYAMPSMPFSANDDLPRGVFTLAFFFRLFARRQPASYNVLGVKLNNLLAPNSLPDGSLYVDLDDQSFLLPTTPDFGTGVWHHFAMSFDAATGILRVFIDGKQARLVGFRILDPCMATLRPVPRALFTTLCPGP